jgi:hypothetical protein
VRPGSRLEARRFEQALDCKESGQRALPSGAICKLDRIRTRSRLEVVGIPIVVVRSYRCMSIAWSQADLQRGSCLDACNSGDVLSFAALEASLEAGLRTVGAFSTGSLSGDSLSSAVCSLADVRSDWAPAFVLISRRRGRLLTDAPSFARIRRAPYVDDGSLGLRETYRIPHLADDRPPLWCAGTAKRRNAICEKQLLRLLHLVEDMAVQVGACEAPMAQSCMVAVEAERIQVAELFSHHAHQFLQNSRRLLSHIRRSTAAAVVEPNCERDRETVGSPDASRSAR